MITQAQLEAHLWGAAELLRGQIDASDYKQFIFPLLFFKRVSDVWDEEFEVAKEAAGGDLDFAAFDENHRFQIPAGSHWRDVREVTKNVGTAIQNALRAIERANPDTLGGIFGDSVNANLDLTHLRQLELDPPQLNSWCDNLLLRGSGKQPCTLLFP